MFAAPNSRPAALAGRGGLRALPAPQRLRQILPRSSPAAGWARRHAPTVAKAAKGFGSAAKAPAGAKAEAKQGGGKKGKVVLGNDGEAVDNIVKRLEAEKEQSDSKAYGRGYVRAPDPEEAKRGRIDYVKIKDWGSGNPDDMGELEVESVGEQFLEADPKRPFYEQLCLRLQVHERNGDLRIAAPKDGRAIPPFEKWSYGLSAYLGYLDGQQLVHAALEKALAAAASAEEGGETCRAVALLDERLGLHRSEAIERDIAAITRESTIPVPQPPNQMAVAYARYLFGLGREAVEATEEGERERARLRLLTNAFCMHVSHLTTGVRVGAQATERFDLIGKGAVATYMDFPESVPNPIAALVRAVNLAGLELGSAGLLECAMEELPKAMPKVSLLLSPLAVEGPSGEDPDLN